MVFKHHLKDALYILLLIFPSSLCFVNMNIDTLEPANGEQIILSASTNETAVTWFFKGNQISYCVISTSSCIGGATNMTFTVITTTSYVTISPYNCNENDGVYLVTTLADSDTRTLKSSIPVSSVTWRSSVSAVPVESQELSVDIPCVYPTTSIQINFTVKTAGEADEVLQLSSNDIQTTGNAGCVCDAGSVRASYSISYPDKTVQVHVSVLHTLLTNKGFTTLDSQGNITFKGPTVTTEMSSTSTSQDQTTSSQNPSIAPFHNTQKTETTVMTTTDNDLTSSSLHVSSEVTTPMKTESDNLTDLGVSAIIAIAISGFIFLFLIIILTICCCQYYRKRSKKKTSEEFQEINDDVVPKFWPNFNSHRYGLNEINGSSVHLAHGNNLYQGERNRGYNFRSKHQSDNYNGSRSDRKIITEKRKHKQKQVQEKISHGFPQSIPDDIMNRHDINGINTYDLHDNNQNTRTYYRGHAVSSPRRFEYRGSFLPHEYINSNRRSSPYMTYLQEHVPRDLEGLTFYQGQNGATNKHSRRYY